MDQSNDQLERICIDPACKRPVVRKVCVVGDRLASDKYHYDLEWLVQCDRCKTIFTVWVIG
jgi:hypothetical protein